MREVWGGGPGTASDMMGLLMVIIGGGFDSNYMIAAQYSLYVCVCVHTLYLREIYTKLHCLFATVACFPTFSLCRCISVVQIENTLEPTLDRWKKSVLKLHLPVFFQLF